MDDRHSGAFDIRFKVCLQGHLAWSILDLLRVGSLFILPGLVVAVAGCGQPEATTVRRRLRRRPAAARFPRSLVRRGPFDEN